MENLFKRVGLTTTLATIALMFWLLLLLQPTVNAANWFGKLSLFAVSLISSFTIYKILAKLLFAIFSNILIFRKIILGKSFVEGTWVGCFTRKINGKPVVYFTVEHYSQKDGIFTVNGAQYEQPPNLVEINKWTSELGRIVGQKTVRYAYKCTNSISGVIHQGIAEFELMPMKFGKIIGFKRCGKLSGHAIDMNDGKSDHNVMYKVSDSNIGHRNAIENARHKFPNK